MIKHIYFYNEMSLRSCRYHSLINIMLGKVTYHKIRSSLSCVDLCSDRNERIQKVQQRMSGEMSDPAVGSI